MVSTSIIQQRNVLIVPIGLERDRVIQSYRVFPANIIYLLYSSSNQKDHVGVDYYSDFFRESVYKELKEKFLEVQIERCNFGSFEDSIRIINDIYQKEAKSNVLNRIFINISTASKIFAISSYIFASQHDQFTELFYMATSSYTLLDHLKFQGSKEDLKKDFLEHGLTKGPYQIIRIPVLKTIQYSSDEIRIIKFFQENKEIRSLKQLMQKLNIEENAAQRIKLQRILEKLRNEGLISIQKEKKIVIIKANNFIDILISALPS